MRISPCFCSALFSDSERRTSTLAHEPHSSVTRYNTPWDTVAAAFLYSVTPCRSTWNCVQLCVQHPSCELRSCTAGDVGCAILTAEIGVAEPKLVDDADAMDLVAARRNG